eukprot:COSAG04_NODE_619_length_11882_cov_18.845880_11_plen_242_part_00
MTGCRPQRAPTSKPEGKANPEVRHQVPAHTQYNKLWLLTNVLCDVNSLGSTHINLNPPGLTLTARHRARRRGDGRGRLPLTARPGHGTAMDEAAATKTCCEPVASVGSACMQKDALKELQSCPAAPHNAASRHAAGRLRPKERPNDRTDVRPTSPGSTLPAEPSRDWTASTQLVRASSAGYPWRSCCRRCWCAGPVPSRPLPSSAAPAATGARPPPHPTSFPSHPKQQRGVRARLGHLCGS